MERERMDGARARAYSSRMLECSFESVCGRQGGRDGGGGSVASSKSVGACERIVEVGDITDVWDREVLKKEGGREKLRLRNGEGEKS
jgi:hypothetical protein